MLELAGPIASSGRFDSSLGRQLGFLISSRGTVRCPWRADVTGLTEGKYLKELCLCPRHHGHLFMETGFLRVGSHGCAVLLRVQVPFVSPGCFKGKS